MTRPLTRLVAGLAMAGWFTVANSAPPGTERPAPAGDARLAPAQPVPAERATAATSTGKTVDRVELDQTTITGNRELPNVMVIVPWKDSSPGAVEPVARSLLDDALEPLDREEFRRELQYRQVLGKTPQASSRGKSGTEGKPDDDAAQSARGKQD